MKHIFTFFFILLFLFDINAQESIKYIESITMLKEKMQISFTEKQIGQEVGVELSFKNVTKNDIYISSDYNYGKYSEEDSVMIFDTEYYNSGYDWLIMPSLPLSYQKILPNEIWKTKKTKKSNEIKRIYLSFNTIEIRESISDGVVNNLNEGFITSEQLYDEKLEDYFEIIDVRLN